MELVAIAHNGEEAVSLCLELRPDLVLMDVQMPKLDGLAATERIMAQLPTPILVITSDPWRGGSDLSFQALSAGALDLIQKPEELPLATHTRDDLLRRIRLLSQIPVIRHVRGRSSRPSSPPQKTTALHNPNERLPIIGVVSSTGGPKTLATLLEALPDRFDAALLIVQHIIPGFSEHLARWLHLNSPLHVEQARHGVAPLPGHAYIAPSEHHLELSPTGLLYLHDSRDHRHPPSGDLLLSSLAKHAPQRSVGLILSGMGDDGALGLADLRAAGGITLAQSPSSCIIPSMPLAATQLGAVQHCLEPHELPDALKLYARQLAARRR
jgi:two-component system chemotaxis response regulator CheB